MKNLLFSSLILSLLVFAGCQQTAAPQNPEDNQPSDSSQSQETKQSGMKIEMIYPDGTTQVVSDFNEEPVESELVSEEPAAIGKGMVITADGFTPKEITMKVGETLLIQNMDEAQHWPASDPHPVHTDHPEFDAAYPMEKDDVYDFVFTESGIYGIHDHMNPDFTATITVVE